jgi:hypothetical protein
MSHFYFRYTWVFLLFFLAVKVSASVNDPENEKDIQNERISLIDFSYSDENFKRKAKQDFSNDFEYFCSQLKVNFLDITDILYDPSEEWEKYEISKQLKQKGSTLPLTVQHYNDFCLENEKKSNNIDTYKTQYLATCKKYFLQHCPLYLLTKLGDSSLFSVSRETTAQEGFCLKKCIKLFYFQDNSKQKQRYVVYNGNSFRELVTYIEKQTEEYPIVFSQPKCYTEFFSEIINMFAERTSEEKQKQLISMIQKILWIGSAGATNGTLLHYAAACDNENFIRFSYENNIFPIDCKNVFGQTPLIITVGCNRTHALELLLDQGAQIDEEDNNKNTALIIANYCRSTRVIELLLSRGADINKTNEDDHGLECIKWPLICLSYYVKKCFLRNYQEL